DTKTALWLSKRVAHSEVYSDMSDIYRSVKKYQLFHFQCVYDSVIRFSDVVCVMELTWIITVCVCVFVCVCVCVCMCVCACVLGDVPKGESVRCVEVFRMRGISVKQMCFPHTRIHTHTHTHTHTRTHTHAHTHTHTQFPHLTTVIINRVC